MALFKSSNPEKAVQRDIDAATANRERISAKLAEAEQATARHAAAAKQAALTGDDAELDLAEASLRAAQDRSSTLRTALTEVDQQLEALERTKAEIADRKLRAQTAAEIELVVRKMTEAGAEFDAAAARLSEYTTRAVPWLWEVRGLDDFIMKAAPPGWEPHKIMTCIDGWVVDPEHEDRIPAAVAQMIARAMPQPDDYAIPSIRARMLARHKKVIPND